MTDREQELRNLIIAYFKKHNRCPNFKSIGSDWYECNDVFKAMHDDGTLGYDGRKVVLK